jgi:hypothetical protein
MVRKIAIGLAAAAIGMAGATSATLAQGQNQHSLIVIGFRYGNAAR